MALGAIVTNRQKLLGAEPSNLSPFVDEGFTSDGHPLRSGTLTAPVSHQKQPRQSKTNAIEIKRNHSKISKADRYSAAHNGLIAGSM
jgi:hypothetical protein